MKKKIFSLKKLYQFIQDIDEYNKMSKVEKIKEPKKIMTIFSEILIVIENSGLLRFVDYNYSEDNYWEIRLQKELKYVPKEIQKMYPEFVFYFLESVEYRGFEYLDDSLKLKNPEICKNAFLKNEKNINYIPQEIINEYPEIYNFEKITDEEKRNDLKLCERALELQTNNLKFIPYDIMEQNIEICVNAIKKNSTCIKFIPNEILIKYPSLYIEALKKNSYYIKDIPDDVKEKNLEICKLAGEYIDYIPEKVLKDNLEIYELSGWNFSNLPEHLKRDEEYLIHAAQKDYTSIKNIIDWFELEFYKEENTKYELSDYCNVFKIAIINNIKAINYFWDYDDILSDIEGVEEILVNALNDKKKMWDVIYDSFYDAIDRLCIELQRGDKEAYKKTFGNERFVKKLLIFLLEDDKILENNKELLQLIPYEIQNLNSDLKIKIAEKIGNGWFYFDNKYNDYYLFEYGYECAVIIKELIVKNKENFIDIFENDIKYIISYMPIGILNKNLKCIKEFLNYILNDENALKWHKNILSYIPYDIQKEFPDLILKLYKKVGKNQIINLSIDLVEKYKDVLVNDYIEICIEDWHNLLKIFFSSMSIEQEIESKVLNYIADNKRLSVNDTDFLEMIPAYVQDQNAEAIIKIYNMLEKYDSKIIFDLSDNIKEKYSKRI